MGGNATYQILMGSPQRVMSLAEEIKASEQRYIDAACDAFRRCLEQEYCRLRGYAIESQRDMIHLKVSATFGFSPTDRFVMVETTPSFNPQPVSSRTTLAPTL